MTTTTFFFFVFLLLLIIVIVILWMLCVQLRHTDPSNHLSCSFLLYLFAANTHRECACVPFQTFNKMWFFIEAPHRIYSHSYREIFPFFKFIHSVFLLRESRFFFHLIFCCCCRGRCGFILLSSIKAFIIGRSSNYKNNYTHLTNIYKLFRSWVFTQKPTHTHTHTHSEE